MVPDHYATLGVDQSCSHAAIRSAYRDIMRHVHPDVAGDDPVAVERALAANQAWTVLKDPVSRASYDRVLASVTTPRAGVAGTPGWGPRSARAVSSEQLREAATRHAAYSAIGRHHREAFSAASRRIGVTVLLICSVLLAMLVVR